MKVRIAFTVDIDPADWELNYGISDRTEIRKDVHVFAEQAVREQFEIAGVPSK